MKDSLNAYRLIKSMFFTDKVYYGFGVLFKCEKRHCYKNQKVKYFILVLLFSQSC